MKCIFWGPVFALATSRQRMSSVLQRTVPYDRDAFVFDPSGRVLQLEYAEEATELGGPVVAVILDDACVVCAWSPRLSAQKICRVDDGTFCAFAGLRADGLALIDQMRVRSARERIGCPEERPSPRKLARAIGDIAHHAARGGGSRCYGARLVVAGLSFTGKPELWTVGPSGVVEAAHGSLQFAAPHGQNMTKDAMECTSVEDVVNALANVILDEHDMEFHALHILAFQKESGGSRCPRLKAWRADLDRREDFPLLDDDAAKKKRRKLDPDAAFSLREALK